MNKSMWCVYMICVLESFASLSWYISIKRQNIFVCYILKIVPINILLLYVCMHIYVSIGTHNYVITVVTMPKWQES